MNESTAAKFRLFIAVPVDESVRVALKAAQSELRARLPDGAVRCTPPEQIHLTLVFLGDTPSGRVPELIALLTPICARFEPFDLCARGVGFFPERGLPRVIWAGITDPAHRLTEIQAAIARAAAGFGEHQEDQKFSAHLTLGRVRKLPRSESRLPMVLAQESAGREFGRWPVTKINLMRSEISSAGAVHRVLKECPLNRREA